jgi:hypothetical protein
MSADQNVGRTEERSDAVPAGFLARPNASSGRGHYRGTPISPDAPDAPRDVFDGRFCRNGASPGPAFTLNLLKDFYRCRIRWFSA